MKIVKTEQRGGERMNKFVEILKSVFGNFVSFSFEVKTSNFKYSTVITPALQLPEYPYNPNKYEWIQLMETSGSKSTPT
jgi:hypothetical protein